jgi:hypothetical protein
MPVMMVAGLYNFITSLGKHMASQQAFIAISRICIIGLGLLDAFQFISPKGQWSEGSIIRRVNGPKGQ